MLEVQAMLLSYLLYVSSGVIFGNNSGKCDRLRTEILECTWKCKVYSQNINPTFYIETVYLQNII